MMNMLLGKKFKKSSFIILCVICFSSPVKSSDVPIIDPDSRFHPVFSSLGMVVSQERIASEVGAAILKKGGNAIDAAVSYTHLTLPTNGCV